MTPWVVTEGLVPKEDVELFEKIKAKINNLPDLDFGAYKNGEKVLLSCHMIARAIAHVFKIRYHDGSFCKYYNHSWVTTPNNNIIDVYPVGVIGGPILYSNDRCSPARHLYKPDLTVCKHFKDESLDKAVAMLIAKFSEPEITTRRYPAGICLGS